ncbi:MAG TPA: aminoglycoside phosphotransferase family protein [Egicoccus sp.]|nr:aminoglycoside phosphotransferase family protein [Egicoccus sp.]HSK23695.1 aminoglycoside phosphotransferase family protein [Egicoccus sp.]
MPPLHHDEVPISEELVRRLLHDQHPDLSGRTLRLAHEQGTDNVVFRLGDDLSVRLPRKASAVPGLLVELAWVPRLAPGLPLPVPIPIARGEPTTGYPFPWAICRWVPGQPPQDVDDLDPVDTSVRLGRFVHALHHFDTTGGPLAGADTQRAGALRAYDQVTRAALAEVTALMTAGRVDPTLFDPAAALDLWEAAVQAPVWGGAGVWLHRDLYAGNLLARDGQLTGVVDFGGLVVGDPAGNVMAAWHVLPPPHRRPFLDIVDADEATQLRARGWVLSQGLLALPYYLDNHPGMVRMAQRAITAALDAEL